MEMIYFALAAVALLIISAQIVPLDELLGLQESTTSQVRDRPYIAVAEYAVTPEAHRRGSDVAYTLTINARLAINEQEKPTRIVPFIAFKDEEKPIKILGTSGLMDTFTIMAGESSGDYVFVADLVTNKPPLQRIEPSDTFLFRLGEPYYFDAEVDKNFYFKIYMNDMMKSGSDCSAQFVAECKEDVEASELLKKCTDVVDSACSETLLPPPCGALIALTVRDVSCADLTARVEYSTDCRNCRAADTVWDISERAFIYFFKIDEDKTTDPLDSAAACVYRFERDRPTLCAGDFLGYEELSFGPPALR